MATKKTEETIIVRPVQIKRVPIRIVGDTPLIVHAWSEKAMRMMLEEDDRKQTRTTDSRNCMQKSSSPARQNGASRRLRSSRQQTLRHTATDGLRTRWHSVVLTSSRHHTTETCLKSKAQSRRCVRIWSRSAWGLPISDTVQNLRTGMRIWYFSTTRTEA